MDLLLIENGNGGDVVLINNDLQSIDGLQNLIYLALFGGNIESNTKNTALGEQHSYWWGNTLIFDGDIEQQMNSNTERVLLSTVLNTQGLQLLQQAIQEDLRFISEIATVQVSLNLISVDRVDISVSLNEPSRLENNTYIFVWDRTAEELKTISEYKTL